MKQKLLLLFLLAMFNSCWAEAAETKGDGSGTTTKTDIAGGVFHSETGKPLPFVTVRAIVSGKERTVQSDANGQFTFDELKKGSYQFVFEKKGYKKLTRETTIIREDVAQSLSVKMEEEATFDFTPRHNHFFDR